MTGRPWLLAPVIALLLVAAPALAQAPSGGDTAPPSGAREQERTALYRQGLALAEEGRWSEALVKFELVVAIRAAPPALVALARAQEEVGRLALAKRTYHRVLEEARATPTAPALVEKATAALASLEARVPRVVVRIPADVLSPQVTIDGQSIAVDSRGAEVDPGRHQVVVSASGKAPFEATFVVDQRQVREIVAILMPAPRAADERPREISAIPPANEVGAGEAASAGRSARWVLAGGGAAALIAGGIIYGLARGDYDRAAKQCPTKIDCPADVGTRGNDARTRMLTGEIVGGVGVFAVVGAAGWWAWQRSARAPAGATSSDAVAHRPFISAAFTSGSALLTGGASF
jgi:tetratricopeptide (TPR) repeat protein